MNLSPRWNKANPDSQLMHPGQLANSCLFPLTNNCMRLWKFQMVATQATGTASVRDPPPSPTLPSACDSSPFEILPNFATLRTRIWWAMERWSKYLLGVQAIIVHSNSHYVYKCRKCYVIVYIIWHNWHHITIKCTLSTMIGLADVHTMSFNNATQKWITFNNNLLLLSRLRILPTIRNIKFKSTSYFKNTQNKRPAIQTCLLQFLNIIQKISWAKIDGMFRRKLP